MITCALPIKKILCAADFSPHSQPTMELAVELAEKMGAEVFFIHVINERIFEELKRVEGRIGQLDNIYETAVNALEDERAEQLKEALGEAQASKVPHYSLVTIGVPYEKILEYAEKENVDLICMGAKGRGAITRHLRFGSAAEKVFRRANCRVIFQR